MIVFAALMARKATGISVMPSAVRVFNEGDAMKLFQQTLREEYPASEGWWGQAVSEIIIVKNEWLAHPEPED